MSQTSHVSLDVPVRDEYLVFGSPQLLDAEIEEVVAALRSRLDRHGPAGRSVRERLRATTSAPHTRVALHSCTAALHLSLIVAGVQPGDEVIVPSMTFGATANAVVHAGGIPVLADVDPQTMNLDPADAAPARDAAHEGDRPRPLRRPPVRHGRASATLARRARPRS